MKLFYNINILSVFLGNLIVNTVLTFLSIIKPLCILCLVVFVEYLILYYVFLYYSCSYIGRGRDGHQCSHLCCILKFGSKYFKICLIPVVRLSNVIRNWYRFIIITTVWSWDHTSQDRTWLYTRTPSPWTHLPPVNPRWKDNYVINNRALYSVCSRKALCTIVLILMWPSVIFYCQTNYNFVYKDI